MQQSAAVSLFFAWFLYLKPLCSFWGSPYGLIYWVAAEHFRELENTQFYLKDMEAVEIEKIDDFSNTAKILLSAVAGAVIQHLIDAGFETESIFKSGSFIISSLE